MMHYLFRKLVGQNDEIVMKMLLIIDFTYY